MFILVNGSGEVPSTEPLANEISRTSLQRMKMFAASNMPMRVTDVTFSLLGNYQLGQQPLNTERPCLGTLSGLGGRRCTLSLDDTNYFDV